MLRTLFAVLSALTLTNAHALLLSVGLQQGGGPIQTVIQASPPFNSMNCPSGFMMPGNPGVAVRCSDMYSYADPSTSFGIDVSLTSVNGLITRVSMQGTINFVLDLGTSILVTLQDIPYIPTRIAYDATAADPANDRYVLTGFYSTANALYGGTLVGVVTPTTPGVGVNPAPITQVYSLTDRFTANGRDADDIFQFIATGSGAVVAPTAAAVPEPAIVPLMMLGIVAGVTARRQRRMDAGVDCHSRGDLERRTA